MSDPIDLKLADNLRRWLESGQPQQWCDAHQGQWDQADWLNLLSSLWWSDYWPLEPAAAQAALDECKKPWNLRRWQRSGQAVQWIAEHGGDWGHADWLALLEALASSEFWPVDPDVLGRLLDEIGGRWRNLERWRQSGLPQRWVAAHQGVWDHADWLALLADLERSEFWPLEPAVVGRLLEDLKVAYFNLVRWQLTGAPRRWVEQHDGQWDDSAWTALLASLRQDGFWPLDLASVARLLEGLRRAWWNVRRWRDAGMARRWVAARQGRWDHGDWLELLASLEMSGYWPIDTAALGRLLEQTRREWQELCRWHATGAPRRWLEARAGRWDGRDLQALVDSAAADGFGPLDVRGVVGLLEELLQEHDNLRRWQASGHAARWVEAHAGGWDHAAWLTLMDELRASEYWPLPPDAVGEALEQHQHDGGAMDVVRFSAPGQRRAA